MAVFIYHHQKLLNFIPKCSKIGVLYIKNMALTMDQFTAKFPHKVFHIIKGETDYQSIHIMRTLLYGNASTLSTTMRGGNHSHIRFIMQNMLYTKISPMPYNVSVDTVGTAQLPTQDTTEVHSHIQD